MQLITFTLLVLFLHVALGARILAFFPFPATSHHNVFRPIILGLAEKGHHITFVTPIPLPKPNPNITEIPIMNSLAALHGAVNLNEFGKYSVPRMVSNMANMGFTLGESVLSSKPVQDLIHSNEKFDLVLLQTPFVQDSVVAFMHKFDAIGVDIMPMGDSSWVNEIAGLPDNPSYMTDFKGIFTDELTYFQRLHNFYTISMTTFISYYYMYKSQSQMDKYFNYTGSETRPHISKLISNKALILVNSHHSTGYAYPKAPHVKEIGGIHIDSSQKGTINKELQTFMDGAKDGVIYFSFGSNLQMAQVSSKELQVSLTKVFGGLKQRVLWKWEGDSPLKVSANIMLSKWFPQQQILAHKNTKVFISHGGYLSISEAIYNGVPIIGIPFFADQPKNLAHAQKEGYGVVINRENMTEASFKWAINEILSNPRYKTEAMRRSQLFKDRPMKPVDEAVYWIEYVLRHRNALQPRGARLTFWVLHMYDIIGTILIVGVLLSCLTTKIFCCKGKSYAVKKEKSKRKKD